jgi:inorganic triphosphatase YgiF
LSSLRRHPLLRALAAGGRATRSELHGVYWDTPNLDLAEAGVALRMRRVGANAVQTLESRAGVGLAAAVSRESDALVASARPNLDAIPDPELRASLASSVDLATLTPVFELRIDRTRRVLHEDGGTLRFDVDVGEIRSARGVVPICDVEIAGRAEDPGHPVRLALELLEALPLRPLGRTLAERGYERASGRGPATYKARPVAVGDGALLEELLVAIAGSGLAQLIENEPAAALGVDPEGVHQVRVAAGRLIVWLELADLRVLRDDLGWLRRSAGRLRDLDVLVGAGAPAAWLPWIEARRAAQRAAFEEALGARRLDGLLAALPLLAPLASARAAERAQKLARKAVRRGQRIESDPTDLEAFHSLRKALRRLRFAREWLGEDASGLRALQTSLGALNDAAVALEHFREWPDAERHDEDRNALLLQLDEQRRKSLKRWRKHPLSAEVRA